VDRNTPKAWIPTPGSTPACTCTRC
jgi:hypothetical protein